MADPTTLLEYAQQRLVTSKGDQATIQGRVDATQGRVTAARAATAEAAARFQALHKERVDVGRQLPDDPTKGDSDGLGKALELAIIRERERNAEVIDTTTALAVAEEELARAVATLGRATQAVAAAESASQRAADRQKRVDDAKALLEKPPLSTVRAAATAAKTSEEFTKAQQRLDGDFPPADANLVTLLAHARSRLATAKAELDAASSAKRDAEASAGAARVAAGLDAEAASLGAALQRAAAAVTTYVATARERLARAVTLLAGIVAAPALTPGKRKDITSLAADASAQTKTEEKILGLGSSPTSVDALGKALQERRLAVLAKGIDPERALEARTILAEAKAELKAAEDAVTKAQKDVDDAVDAATTAGVPDPNTDPTVIQKRADLVIVTKTRDDQQKVVDAATAAAGTDPAVDALVAAADALAQAKATAATDESAWKAKEAALEDARKALGDAQAALGDAVRAAKNKNVDPETDADVMKAAKAVEEAQTALDDADLDYRSNGKGKLDVWEAAVPDSEWRILVDFEEVKALLDTLANDDPAAILNEQTNAEKALVAALITAADRARQAALVEDEAAARAARYEILTRDRGARLLAAFRGDR